MLHSKGDLALEGENKKRKEIEIKRIKCVLYDDPQGKQSLYIANVVIKVHKHINKHLRLKGKRTLLLKSVSFCVGISYLLTVSLCRRKRVLWLKNWWSA